ncbi:MAG: OmpA family protein [Flavobacteriaceae bacterium]|nr:OmpA family protein [Flavobacteriaceae bacterium]
MKKIFLFTTIVYSTMLVAQTNSKINDSIAENLNKWTFEVAAGQLKGIYPFADGYFSSNSNKKIGTLDINSFSIGSRYSLSSKFGIKIGLHYEQLKNLSNNSLPFKMKQIGISFQGVVNASRLLNIEKELGRFGILVHGGLKIDQLTSKTPNTLNNFDYNKKELNGGLLLGITPQYRVSNKIAFFADITTQNNYRQHFNWDGSLSNLSENNMKGQAISTAIGLTYSLGKNQIHGDWSKIKDENTIKIDQLNKHIDAIETLMNDSDKDGVADHLDQENNSVAGVAVDSRGKMVDGNRNGVPDELERYIDNKINKDNVTDKPNTNTLENLIDGEYVAVYFEPNKAIPTNSATQGLNFIRTFLKANPETNIFIIGHADEIGSNAKNNELAEGRAIATKEVLTKSGIDPKRLIIKAESEDKPTDTSSTRSRDLVRKVTFKIVR